MNTVEKIFEKVQTLTETDAREVLDFVEYLKSKRQSATIKSADLSEFDKFGRVYNGNFDRDECYDRKVLR